MPDASVCCVDFHHIGVPNEKNAFKVVWKLEEVIGRPSSEEKQYAEKKFAISLLKFRLLWKLIKNEFIV